MGKNYISNAKNVTKEIGHINGVKTDNRPENLEFCEMNSDNIISPYVLCDFTRIPSASASSSPVVKIDSNGTRLSAYLSVKDAAQREGKTPEKIFSLLRTASKENNIQWLHLRDYFKHPHFTAQSKVITTHQRSTHPWVM